jgi:hypothetical protein
MTNKGKVLRISYEHIITPSIAMGPGGEVLSLGVEPKVTEAITRWAERNEADLARELAPFGMHPTDLLVPEYRRVVSAEDLMLALGITDG